MELTEAMRRRRMVRSFSDRPLDHEIVENLISLALTAPTAGNTGGTAWCVLEDPGQRARYWELTTTPDWRAGSRRWDGLSRAPVVALSLASPALYGERYAEPDKAESGLGFQEDEVGEWPIPYWFGDAAFSTMALFLAAPDSGLAAGFLGNFRGESELMDELAVPSGWRLFGSVLLGYPDGLDHPSPSLQRAGPSHASRVHFDAWKAAV